MTHALRFQLFSTSNLACEELLRRFRMAEELGFDVAGVGDHFVDWAKPTNVWFEPWTILAAAAVQTTRIRLGPYVAQIPLRDPATLARLALNVDHISGGRLELGLGIGLTIDPSYRMMGLPNWSNGERVARFGEYVEVVDRLLTNETTSYEGDYYRIEEAIMKPRPIQRPRPPITIAAMGPKMLAHAARHADIWNSMSFAATFEEQLAETRDRVGKIDGLCADIGRDPATLARSYWMFDPGSRASGGAISYYASEDAFTDVVERVAALGITEFGMYYPMLDEQLPMLERIATDTIPALKAAHG